MQKGTDISKRLEEQNEKLRNTFKSIRGEINNNREKIEELQRELDKYNEKESKKKIQEFFKKSNSN